MANKDSSQALKCSFCGKSQKQVIKLIAGPGVYICDECIELCVEIIEEEKVEKLETSSEEYLPLPKRLTNLSTSTSLAKKMQRRPCLLQFIIITKEFIKVI